MTLSGPHQGLPPLRSGTPLNDAHAGVVLVHGRGGSAEDILSLAERFLVPSIAYLAPQAANHTWYPYSFLAPIPQNEPGLTSGLTAIGQALDSLGAAGLDATRCVLLGFSQGACLALEFSARNARRFGGIMGLSGGLIGPEGTPRNYPGSLAGTPIFLGCSDIDPHIPVGRVRESAAVFQGLGGSVDMRLYPGMGHTVNDDEIEAVRSVLEAIVLPPSASKA